MNNLYPVLISDANILQAIREVNKGHRWNHDSPNRTVLWVEDTLPERVRELRDIVERGFTPSPARCKRRYDYAARKWREIHEPRLWPDQYIHHMVIQVLQPVMMRGMDYWCCGSIRGRGTNRGIVGLRRWIRRDPKHSKYAAELDIHHFYDSLTADTVLNRLRQLVKDERMLDVVARMLRDGIMIGAYFSQWFANTVLQPLDHMIREQLHIRHYVRYMDNITLLGSNKRELHRAVIAIDEWLHTIGLRLKGNWQVFNTGFKAKTKARRAGMSETQRKRRLPRLVNAMGYRFGKTFTLLRKRNLLRLKRQIKRVRAKLDAGIDPGFRSVAGLLSRIGQLKHCNCCGILRRYVPRGLQKQLKDIVRAEARRRKEQQSAWILSTTSAPCCETASSGAVCAPSPQPA